jgi:peptidoglycan/xylan/chitin deacetylase (PgdA/CDA1 family)/GT2 family glycosyltransferase
VVKVSVVIPTFNRRELLASTLPTVLAQDLPPDEFEVIVVSDGSADGTRELVEALRPECGLQFLDRPRSGAAATRNAGARAASGGVVLFLDDDFVCPLGLVRAHAEAHRRIGSPAVVSGRIEVDAASRPNLLTAGMRLWYEEYFRGRSPGVQPGLRQGAWLISNTSLPRSLFLDCGGFDEEMPWPREDVELGLRLIERGIPLVYEPSAVAAERVATSTAGYFSRTGAATGRAEVELTRKHPWFRPSSLLTPIGRTLTRRTVRAALIRSPLPPSAVLRAPLAVLEALPGAPPVQAAGRTIAGLSYHLAIQRSARAALGSWATYAREYGQRAPALLYHRVGPPQPATHPALTVSPHDFERQMSWLSAHGYTGIAPSEWLAWCVAGAPLPPKPVIITFDDAYRDLVTHAFPVLERLGFRAGVYVVSNRVGKTYDWDEHVSGEHHLLAADDLRVWSKRGIEVGAHSRTHRRLTSIPHVELPDEIVGSGEALRGIVHGVRTFAYPYGAYDDNVLAETRTGFDLAFTVEEHLNDLGTDLFRLGRTMVQPGRSIFEFSLQVRLGSNPVQRLRERAAHST